MSENLKYVTVSVANVYRNATYHSEIDTQVTLGEMLQMIEVKGDFVNIKTEDGYIGWVSGYQLADATGTDFAEQKLVTGAIFKLHNFPAHDSEIVSEVVAGCRVSIDSEENGWAKIQLPDNSYAWLQADALIPSPPLSRENLIEYSKQFLGVPYFWGGKTPKGVDCSGFIQMVFKLFGVSIRRDAWMQHQDSAFVSKDPMQFQRGDLLFFAENGERITHVGIGMNDGMFIHARGKVRINSLVNTHPHFDKSLLDSFVDVRTFL